MPGWLRNLAFAALLACAPALAGQTGEATLEVQAMTCALCSITVKKVLQRVPGYVDAKIDVDTKRALVIYDTAKTAPETLARAVTDAGFPAMVVTK